MKAGALILVLALLPLPAGARGAHPAAAPKAAPTVPRDAHGRIARSPVAKHSFMAAKPCPGGPDAGSSTRCRGFVVDHVKPLACGGADAPANMQWQTVEAGKAKDLIERKGC